VSELPSVASRDEGVLGKLPSLPAGVSVFEGGLLELKAYAPGIYPRSEALVQATRDLDRGRVTQEAVDAQVAEDLRQLVEVQERAGLTLLSDGLLRWQDHFRPLVERSPGLDARPLTRFLDTNTFFRAVLVEGEPRLREPVEAPDLPAGRWLASLPSPYAFSRAADGAVSAKALAANVLAPQIDAYASEGAALIVLIDPFVARDGDVAELVGALAELPHDVPFALQLSFGDAGPVLANLAEAPVEAIGVDFYSTGLDAVPTDYPKEIIAGVIDSRSSALEDPAEIGRFAEELAARNPAGVSLSPNGDLQFVPETIAREKIARLGRSTAALEEVA
jgi:5-methyltetrahydropteroyltriglutamate--homocysteine methyltransferase